MSRVSNLIVCITILFSLYFIGVFTMIFQLALNTMPNLSSIVKIKEVPDQVPVDPLAGLAGVASIDSIIATKKIEMSNQMKQVVSGMEDLIKDMNLDSLSEQERQEALAELYEKFPVMEATLSKSLEMDEGLGIDPAITIDHQNRLASIKILLDESKPKAVKQLPEKVAGQEKEEENILDKENSNQFEEEENLKSPLNELSSKKEFENNISDHASKPNENKKENNDPLEGKNVHQKENVHTEL